MVQPLLAEAPYSHDTVRVPGKPGRLEKPDRLAWLLQRVRNHWRWAREQGLRRLIEEDQIDPIERAARSLEKRRWRRAHRVAPSAVPVFVVGLQRSGTNMLTRGFERRPEFEVHNENSRRAFERFQLRPNPVIRDIVARSGHRFVLFKPLCDSHRTTELLDHLGTVSPGRAIWVFRSVDGRVRSAIAKFGPTNLRVLSEIAAGRGDGLWQAQGLSNESRDFIRSIDYAHLSPESAAALFWYVRNSLYFELGLHERDDVMLASYDSLLRDGSAVMRVLCRFLDLPYDPDLVAHVDSARSPDQSRLAIEGGIRARCDELAERLGVAEREKRAAFGEVERAA
jgi:hypothetical protein